MITQHHARLMWVRETGDRARDEADPACNPPCTTPGSTSGAVHHQCRATQRDEPWPHAFFDRRSIPPAFVPHTRRRAVRNQSRRVVRCHRAFPLRSFLLHLSLHSVTEGEPILRPGWRSVRATLARRTLPLRLRIYEKSGKRAVQFWTTPRDRSSAGDFTTILLVAADDGHRDAEADVVVLAVWRIAIAVG
jgi:hypothetical protein